MGSCPAREIEGLTLSAGEPFEQAGDLRHLCEYIKTRQPDLSIGVFSGYTVQELVRGRWHWKALGKNAWIKGDPALFLADQAVPRLWGVRPVSADHGVQ